ncbi:MAG TPA: universal stress protein [Ktedonobacterales bacterium]|nr:universal stress protein [Ktedonobacterales bacterium]
MDTLERSPHVDAGAAKADSGSGLRAIPQANILPLAADERGQAPARQRNILVALTDTSIDDEAVSVACSLARKRKVEAFAVFGIQVPRKRALDDEMPEETEKANRTLDAAKDVAEQLQAPLETEIVHTRHLGQALIQEAVDHDCALIVMGVPYQVGVNGQFALSETAEYVLKHAPSRVWLVRGPCDSSNCLPGQSGERA